MERHFQALYAEQFSLLIVSPDGRDPMLQRAFLNGMLTALSAHLVTTKGPRAAYETFQRIADECARSLLNESRA